MNTTCTTIRDRLPELAAGRLGEEARPPVEAHLAECAECRETLAALTLLAAAPPPVPDGLEARVQAAARDELRRSPATGRPGGAVERLRRFGWRTPALGLAAAAVLALVLGRTLLPGSREGEADFLALADGEVQLLLPDDGMVAGAPMLDGLSDEDLALLLDEMER